MFESASLSSAGRACAQILSFAVALAAGGCNQSGADSPRDARVVQQLTPALTPVIDGNNEFAWDLYRAAAAAPGNLFFSPFSISAALGMTYAGAAGSTADQMRSTLAIQTSDAEFHTQFGALIRDLSGEKRGRGYQLLVANRLFVQAGMQLQSEFATINADDYAAPAEALDFNQQPDAARDRINAFVKQRTADKIPELMAPGTPGAGTALVAVDAIYFNASWAERFDPNATTPQPFRLASGDSVSVPMMSHEGHYGFASDDATSVIELPYQDDELSLVVLLPKDQTDLATLEASLDRDRVNAWIGQLNRQELTLTLPKFELASELPAKSLLQSLGMTVPFESGADFSKMFEPAQDVYIDDVIHKAYVKVDERGTEAAAATAVTIKTVSAALPFVIDHPFVYFVRDRLTGAILFIGRLEDPR